MIYPNKDVPVTSLNVKINSIIDGGIAGGIQNSNFFDTLAGSRGTHLTPHIKRQAGLQFEGAYDFSSSYSQNEIITVDSDVEYIDEFGDPYSARAGSWVNVLQVPWYYDTFDRAAILAANVPSDVLDTWTRQEGIDYTPHDSSTYWKRIGGGSGGSSTLDEWNSSSSYASGVRVRYTGSITEYVWGTASYWVYPCIAHCERATIPLFTTGSMTGSLQIPYYPEPDDPDLLYWKIESMGIRQISTCDGDNGLTSVWSNTQDFEPSGSPQVILEWG